jgi:hypothetical protein
MGKRHDLVLTVVGLGEDHRLPLWYVRMGSTSVQLTAKSLPEQACLGVPIEHSALHCKLVTHTLIRSTSSRLTSLLRQSYRGVVRVDK